jgi:outer membrane protein TolC
MSKKIIPSLLLLGALVHPAQAEERPLSLEEAVSIALQYNPDVVRAGYGLEEAKGRRLQSEARPEPQLALSTEGIPSSSRGSAGFGPKPGAPAKKSLLSSSSGPA